MGAIFFSKSRVVAFTTASLFLLSLEFAIPHVKMVFCLNPFEHFFFFCTLDQALPASPPLHFAAERQKMDRKKLFFSVVSWVDFIDGQTATPAINIIYEGKTFLLFQKPKLDLFEIQSCHKKVCVAFFPLPAANIQNQCKICTLEKNCKISFAFNFHFGRKNEAQSRARIQIWKSMVRYASNNYFVFLSLFRQVH